MGLIIVAWSDPLSIRAGLSDGVAHMMRSRHDPELNRTLHACLMVTWGSKPSAFSYFMVKLGIKSFANVHAGAFNPIVYGLSHESLPWFFCNCLYRAYRKTARPMATYLDAGLETSKLQAWTSKFMPRTPSRMILLQSISYPSQTHRCGLILEAILAIDYFPKMHGCAVTWFHITLLAKLGTRLLLSQLSMKLLYARG
ncbi:hypothetical protein VNO77_27329 [Canavalia gladiata]|uniref:Uncharacterized protein n=1 Tax=Canavalia gladiata TaxID=3824 RepID=A0AAN9KX22_CANGL